MAIVKNFAKEDITSITIDSRAWIHINAINSNVAHEMIQIIKAGGGFTFEVPNSITIPSGDSINISVTSGNVDEVVARLENRRPINFNLKQIYQLQVTRDYPSTSPSHYAQFIYITSVNAGAITDNGKFAHAIHKSNNGIKTIVKDGKVLTFGRVSLPQPTGPLDYHNIYEQFQIANNGAFEHPLSPASVTGNIVAIIATSEGASTDLIYGSLNNSWTGTIDVVRNSLVINTITMQYYPDRNVVHGHTTHGGSTLGTSTIVDLNILESK